MSQTGTVYMDVVYNTQKATADLVKATTPAAGAAASAFSKSFEDKLASTGAKTAQVGKQMSTNLTLPLVGLGAVAIKEFTGYERSLASIEGLVGASKEQMAGYTESVRRVGVEFGIGADAAAKALYFITSSGLEGAAAIDALEISAKASAVGLGETEVVADLLTSALNAYQKSNLSAAGAADILTAAVKDGKGDADELAGAMSRVLPVASQMGVSFEEVGGAFAAMTLQGTDANEAATQIRGILVALQDPSAEAKKALQEIGLSAGYLRDKIANDGLLPTLEELQAKLGGNQEATAKIFGDVRALTGVYSILGDNLGKTKQIFDDTANATGALGTAMDVTADTAGLKLNKAMAELNLALIDLGDSAAPGITAIASAVAKLAGAFDSLPGPVKTVAVLFGGVLAALGPILYVGGKLAQTFSAISKAATFLSGPSISKGLSGIGVDAETANKSLEATPSRLGAVSKAMLTGTAAVAGFATAWQIWQSYMDEAAASAAGARDQIDKAFGNTTSVDQAEQKLETLRQKIEEIRVEAAKNQDGKLELSDITQIGTRAALDASLPGFQAQADAQQKLIDQAKELATATGGTADAMLVFLEQQSTAGTTYATTDEALKAYKGSLTETGAATTAAAGDVSAANTAFDEQRKKVSGLQTAFLAFTAGQKSYQDAVEGISTAQRAYEDSTRGVASAQRSYVQSSRSVASAQQGLADANRGVTKATKGYEDALRSVESAQRGVTDAQKALDDALSPEEDQIALERARIRVEDARKALAEKPAKGDDANTKKTKELDLRQAEIDLLRLQAEVEAHPGDREQALTDAQQKLTDAQLSAQDALLGITDANRQVTDASFAVRDAQQQQADASLAVRDAQLKQADAAKGVIDAQDKAALSAIELYGKQLDLNTAFRDNGAYSAEVIAELETLKGLYPEVAASLDPYIDKLRVLRALHGLGSGVQTAAPTRDPDFVLGGSGTSSVGQPFSPGSGFTGPQGNRTTVYDMNGMAPQEAFVYAQHTEALQLTTLAGG